LASSFAITRALDSAECGSLAAAGFIEHQLVAREAWIAIYRLQGASVHAERLELELGQLRRRLEEAMAKQAELAFLATTRPGDG